MLLKLSSIYHSSRNFLYHLLSSNLLFYQLSSRRVSENERKLFSLFTSDVHKALSLCTSDNTAPLDDIFICFQGLGNSLDIIIKLLYSLHNNSAINLDKYYSLLRELPSISKSRLAPLDWKRLGYVTGAYGLFRLSYCCYNKASEIALEEQPNKSSHELAQECLTLMEAFNMPQVLELFNTQKFSKMISSNHRIKLVREHRLYDIQLFLAVLNNEPLKIREFSEKHFTKQDINYLRYIEGKTVAIVGPAYSDNNNGNEIDSFDIVIRLNYRGKSENDDINKIGTKTHISYYNSQDLKSAKNSKNKNFLNELDFWVLKSKNDVLAENKDNILDKKQRLNLALNYVHMLNGYPNMIQCVLFDLILFRPRRIKIFNVNFYSLKKIHLDGYKPIESKLTGQQLCWDFTDHHLISNLALMRNLYYADYYEPDDNMLQILKLTNEEYMKVMEDIYLQVRQ